MYYNHFYVIMNMYALSVEHVSNVCDTSRQEDTQLVRLKSHPDTTDRRNLEEYPPSILGDLIKVGIHVQHVGLLKS